MRAESVSQSQAFTGMKTRKVEKQNKTVNDWPENEMGKKFHHNSKCEITN